MSFDQRIALFSAIFASLTLVVSTGGFLTLIKQLRDAAKQRESDAEVKVYDINRELMGLGFSHHGLFEILEGKPHAHPLWEKRYLQLWLNQLSLTYSFIGRSTVSDEMKVSFERNLVDFMTLANMRSHWQESGHFYPDSFQKHVAGILKRLEPPPGTAQAKPK